MIHMIFISDGEQDLSMFALLVITSVKY